MRDCFKFVKLQEWVSETIYTKKGFVYLATAADLTQVNKVGVCIVFHSIIVKLKEHEEFFPVFHSFILELLQTLGENKLYSLSTRQESVKLK